MHLLKNLYTFKKNLQPHKFICYEETSFIFHDAVYDGYLE